MNPQVPKQTCGFKDNRLLWARAVQASGGPEEAGAQDRTCSWPFRFSAAGWGWGVEWDTGQAGGGDLDRPLLCSVVT